MRNLRNISLFVFFGIIANSARSQEFVVNLYGNHAFDSKVSDYVTPFTFYSGTLNQSFYYGTGLEAYFGDFAFELKYMRSNTTLDLTYPDEQGDDLFTIFDADVNYILISPKTYFVDRPEFQAYAGLDIGPGIFRLNSPDLGFKRPVRLAWGFDLGANVYITDWMAIKAQAGFISTTEYLSAGLFLGTGGVSAGAAAYSSFFQFNIGGGLTFNLSRR